MWFRCSPTLHRCSFIGLFQFRSNLAPITGTLFASLPLSRLLRWPDLSCVRCFHDSGGFFLTSFALSDDRLPPIKGFGFWLAESFLASESRWSSPADWQSFCHGCWSIALPAGLTWLIEPALYSRSCLLPPLLSPVSSGLVDGTAMVASVCFFMIVLAFSAELRVVWFSKLLLLYYCCYWQPVAVFVSIMEASICLSCWWMMPRSWVLFAGCCTFACYCTGNIMKVLVLFGTDCLGLDLVCCLVHLSWDIDVHSL